MMDASNIGYDVQALLEQRQIIDELLQTQATFSPSNYPSQSSTYNMAVSPATRRDISRSLSVGGKPMAPDTTRFESVPISKSISHRPALQMAHSMSQPTSQLSTLHSYNNATQVPLSLQTTNNRLPTAWINEQGRPQPYQHQAMPAQMSRHRSYCQHRSDLPQVVELGSDPQEYFASYDQSQTATASVNHMLSLSNQHTNSLSRRRESFGLQTPSTPSSCALTYATTAADMSRQNSYAGLLSPLGMMRINSQAIDDCGVAEDTGYDSVQHNTNPSFAKVSSSEEQDLLVCAALGGGLEDTQMLFPPHHGLAMQTSPMWVDGNGCMERSPSTESSESFGSAASSSSQARSKMQLKRTNLNASRPLMPKAGADATAMSREGSRTLHSSKYRSGSEGGVLISKTSYQRPKHERVHCTQCNEVPEGFRGPHELGRHHDRQHKGLVKKFMCMEPIDGINPEYKPQQPLSKCKACQIQKKKYGAYYNAAAHLRRAHFKPKARKSGRNTKIDEKPERRGGKAGGDWPPMSELKRWMVEVPCKRTDDPNEEDGEEEAESNDDVDDIKYEYELKQDVDTRAMHYENDIEMFDAQNVTLPLIPLEGMSFDVTPQLCIDDTLPMQFDASQQFIPDSYLYDDPFYSQQFDQPVGQDIFSFQ